MMLTLEQDLFKQAHEQYRELVNTLSEAEAQGWEHG